jgi:hypothetical protein
MIGAHLLSETAGFPSYVSFWTAMGNGEKWPSAFESAFGVTSEAFDKTFAKAVGF